MVIDMNEAKLTTLEQVRAFLVGTVAVEFSACGKGGDRYAHIAEVLHRFGYKRLKKPDKGLILRYLERTTDYSRQQLTRIVKRWRTGKKLVKTYRAPKHGLARKLTDADLIVLAETDSLHGTLSGPATRHLMARALEVFGDTRYERLATISVGHLYNLRKRHGYVDRRRVFAKTRPTGIAIGQRRAPAPDGRPGFIRIDSVHQGDQDGTKGVYHINAVDCITQWELVATCERISEAYLLPLIEALLAGFPFRILGFHADNGSEYINHKVAKMLDKLAAEFTKSRPRHSQRQRPGRDQERRSHPQASGLRAHPAALRRRGQYLVCRAPESVRQFPSSLSVRQGHHGQEGQDDESAIRSIWVRTPFEKLASLPDVAMFLRPGVTLDALRTTAMS